MTTEPEGFLDSVGRTVKGWVWWPPAFGHRLRVEVLFDGRLRVAAVADQHRADLEAAGKGDGRYGFAIPMPEVLADCEHAVDVRLPEFPGARLLGSPRTAIFNPAPATLRAARPTDADVERLRLFLAEILRLNGAVAADALPEAAAVHAWLSAPDRCCLVVERQGRFVGYCQVGPDWPAEPGSDALALGIELHPDFRGFGLGRLLMQAAHRWAAGRAARMELAVLPHNVRARRFYRRLGYGDVKLLRLPATGEVQHHMALALPARRWPDSVVMVV